MGDLFGGQSADFPKRHRRLRIRGDSRVAAGEDQPQHVVLDRFHVARLRFVDAIEAVLDVLLRGIETRTPPDRVDRLEAAGRDKPAGGVGGNAIDRPCSCGGRKGIVQRLLRAVEIAEQSDQRRQHPARLGSVDLLDDAFQGAPQFGRVSVRTGLSSTAP